MDEPIDLLIYVRDLLFSSKIVATARAHHVPFKVVRDGSKLSATTARRLVVDLNVEGNLQLAIAWKKSFGGEVIGFSSHTAVDLIKAARAGGIDRVMTNGSFTANLDGIVAGGGDCAHLPAPAAGGEG